MAWTERMRRLRMWILEEDLRLKERLMGSLALAWFLKGGRNDKCWKGHNGGRWNEYFIVINVNNLKSQGMTVETRTSCWDPTRDRERENGAEQSFNALSAPSTSAQITCLHLQLSIEEQSRLSNLKDSGRWRMAATGLVILEMENSFAHTPGGQAKSCCHSDSQLQAREQQRWRGSLHAEPVGGDKSRYCMWQQVVWRAGQCEIGSAQTAYERGSRHCFLLLLLVLPKPRWQSSCDE